MIKRNFWLTFSLTLFLIPGLILSACGPAASADNFVTSRRASPTLSAVPVAEQPTQPSATLAPLQVRLAVIKSRARINRKGNVHIELQQAQSADLQIDDEIEIIKPDGKSQQSYSLLYLPDFVNVELFANTKTSLADMRQGLKGLPSVTLNLDYGHMFVHLNEVRSARVMVLTPHTTIKTLTSGTEFDVCRIEELTCLVVRRGIVEIVAQKGKDIVRAGSAAVVLNDQLLSPVICAPAPKFIAWEDQYRRSVNTSSLQDEIAELPQTSCPVEANGFPLNARILYEDEFTTESRGWVQGKINNFTVRNVRNDGARYYQVQAEGTEDQFLAFVPNERNYKDVNIDIKTRTELTGSGDFRYGVVFRRSGDQYYAFVVSPLNSSWYFLKSTSDGLKVLKFGIVERMRGLDGQDTLHVETYGSTFLAFINDRYIDWVSDSDYAIGEVGLFVDTVDNPNARINFNSITIWDIPEPVFNPDPGEKCFNATDDDGDGLIDQADPNCQRPALSVTSLLTPSQTPSLLPTNTPETVETPTVPPHATNPPASTATNQPPSTQPPAPSATNLAPTLPLPTVVVPLPTISLPLPTIVLPLPILPPAGTPMP